MNTRRLAFFSFIFLFAYEILVYKNPFGISPDMFFLLIYISIFFASLYYRKSGILNGVDKVGLYLIYALVIVMLISFSKAFYSASNYYETKALYTGIFGLTSFLCLGFILIGFSVSGFFYLINSIKKYLPYILPILIVYYLIAPFAFPRLLTFIFMLVLLYPFLSSNLKKLVILTAVLSILMGSDWRSNVIRLFVVGVIAFFPFLQLKGSRFKKFLVALFILIPVVAIYYSIQVQSVFELNLSSNTFLSEDYKVDTRTFLYREVFSDLTNTNSLLLGKGLSGTYASDFFDFEKGRGQVEVGFLKYLLQIGLIGFLIMSFLLFRAIYLGINKSRNKLAKQFSVYLSFHFLFLFIESVPSFNQYYFFIWTVIGLLLTKKFRELSDVQIYDLLNWKRAYLNERLPNGQFSC